MMTLTAIGNHLWQSTLFAVVAGLLTTALRSNHVRWRYWLWLTASVKFCIPFAVLAAIGRNIHWGTAAAASGPGVYLAIESISRPFHPAAPAPHAAGAHVLLNYIPLFVFGLWFCGCLAVAASWLARWRRVRAIVRQASPFEVGMATRLPVLSSSGCLEPGVFGIRRPVLLLPEGIASHLSGPQLQAILAHEVCHVCHRDNLASAIHMGVEALFWFHPLVWWIGARLVDERERACDEEVVRGGGDPEVYAAGILNACKFYLESPLPCVAGITGGNLSRRIERIMRNQVARPLDAARKVLLSLSAIAAVLVPVTAGFADAPRSQAQTQADAETAPAFEVASIKAAPPGIRGYSIRPYPGRLSVANCTLKMLIAEAYHVYDFQVSGGPKWLDSDRYNIEAKAASGTTPDHKQIRAMLRKLLADRFQLAIRRETKDLPHYALELAKGGSKMQPSKDTQAPVEFGVRMRRQVTAKNAPLSYLAETLSFLLGRVVEDSTGLTGAFDYKLEWMPDEAQVSSDENPTTIDSNVPSLFSALQEQLGLRLESRKGPVEILIVDRAEKASEN